MARLTARQKQSQKIAREKARKLRIRSWWRRTCFVGISVTALAIGLNGWSMYRSGEVHQWLEKKQDGFFARTASMGFVVKNIYLEGRKETPMPSIAEALGMQVGAPILATSVHTLKERLEGLDWVEYAAVERVLPDTLHIHIVERRPVAIWQNEGKLTLIDMQGMVMQRQDMKKFGRLPLIVGEDAPQHTAELLRFLASEPALFAQVSSAIRVGERRWNIRFNNGVEAKLPENDPDLAWHKLAGMEKDQHVLARDIVAVDMRLSDRVSFTLSPNAVKRIQDAAKET